jgi:hypothetical protein
MRRGEFLVDLLEDRRFFRREIVTKLPVKGPSPGRSGVDAALAILLFVGVFASERKRGKKV